MCHGVVCDLPLCTAKVAGGLSGGVGRPKAHPSKVGRTKREQDYAKAHRFCERGCGRPTRHVHHTKGRGLGGWNRDLSPLEALCEEHHLAEHGQAPAPKKAAAEVGADG